MRALRSDANSVLLQMTVKRGATGEVVFYCKGIRVYCDKIT